MIFEVGQRVRILPCKNYPPTSLPGGIRYGIIQVRTQHPGMHLMNAERPSEAGEWAYCVASWASPNAGAMWFSEAGLRPMARDEKKTKTEESKPKMTTSVQIRHVTNRSNCKKLALEIAQAIRAQKFERVGKSFLDRIEAKARAAIAEEVRIHPSKGKTLL